MTIELATLILVAITSVLTLLTAAVGLWKVLAETREVKHELNSRLDQMLKNVAESEHAKGVLQQKERQSGGGTDVGKGDRS